MVTRIRTYNKSSDCQCILWMEMRMLTEWHFSDAPHYCFETQINIDLCEAFHIQASLTKHCHFAFKGLNKGIQIKWIPSMTIKTCWVTDRQTVVSDRQADSGEALDQQEHLIWVIWGCSFCLFPFQITLGMTINLTISTQIYSCLTQKHLIWHLHE